jgi:hypothetical protein
MNNNINERVLYDSSVMLRRVAATLADMGLSASEQPEETDDDGRFWQERTLLVTNNQHAVDSTGTPPADEA